MPPPLFQMLQISRGMLHCINDFGVFYLALIAKKCKIL